MIELTTENPQKAIERCKQLKPTMKFIKDGFFAVYSANNENVYHVSFDVKDGKKRGQCECKTSERGLACYTEQAINFGKYEITIFCALGALGVKLSHAKKAKVIALHSMSVISYSEGYFQKSDS